MIKCKEGAIKINGSKADIMADLCTILQCLTDEKALSDDEVDLCVKLSRADDEEKSKMLTDIIMKDIYGIINNVKGELEDGE